MIELNKAPWNDLVRLGSVIEQNRTPKCLVTKRNHCKFVKVVQNMDRQQSNIDRFSQSTQKGTQSNVRLFLITIIFFDCPRFPKIGYNRFNVRFGSISYAGDINLNLHEHLNSLYNALKHQASNDLHDMFLGFALNERKTV